MAVVGVGAAALLLPLPAAPEEVLVDLTDLAADFRVTLVTLGFISSNV